MTTLEPAARGVSLGKLSVLIAIAIFAAMAMLLMFLYLTAQNPNPPTMLHDVVGYSVIAVMFVVAPLGHFAGLVLGFIAFSCAGDRRDLAVTGVLLNIVVVAIEVLLIICIVASASS